MPPTSPEADLSVDPALSASAEEPAVTGRAATVVADLKGGLARILGTGTVGAGTRNRVAVDGQPMASGGDLALDLTSGGSVAAGDAAAPAADVGVRIVQPENDAESLAKVLSAPPSFLEVLQGHDGDEAVIRHRLEYQEPSIWMWRRIVGASFAFIVVTVTWYLVKVPSGLISDEALPTLTQAATAFNEVRAHGFADESLLHHLGASLFRLVMGLGIGTLLGVALGLATGAAPLTRTIVDPIASFFRMVPGLIIGPLALIWFGVGETATVAVVAFSVMWTVMTSVCDVRTRLLRGSKLDLLLEIIAGMRSALLLAWVTVLAVETVVASSGLGPMIWFAQDRSDVIVVGICLAGFLGFALDTLIRALEYTLVNRT